uniref:Uncharacterized protein n=1 Tax=Euplotes harpa TaxID=151035 RepID=A0A7S3N5Y7_9SPIT|mmetsp:Transcript_1451/g.1690  ORF Transcript_1451/g.1690 Transcript_1451/m.1690 type:complete len:169 (+) Transcript_1451:33-539(+)
MNTESVSQQGVLNSYKMNVDARMVYGFVMKADGKSEAYPLGKHNGPSSLIDKVLHTSNETASLPKYCPKVRGRSHDDKSPSLHVLPHEHKEEQSEEHKHVGAVQVLADRVHNNKHLVIMKARLKKKPELDEAENDRIKLAFERYKQSKRQKGYSRIASHSPLYYNSNR